MFFNFKNFSNEFMNCFITNELKSLNERNSINKEIDFYHSKKFHDDILKYFRKYIKDLRYSMFAIDIINGFNYHFICVY